MILINIDKRKDIPLYLQVYSELKQMISESTLKAGERLPATRQLAESLGLNRSTILRAYEELWTEGYLESRPGSYSIVRQRKDLVSEYSEQPEDTYNWTDQLNRQTSELTKKMSKVVSPKLNSDMISFLDLSPDNRLIPIDNFRKSINHILRKNGELALQYGNAQGHEPLRKILAQQLNRHNIAVNEEEILITNGAQDGLNLILRTLIKPGSVIITENPGYPNANLLFQYCGATIVGIPVENDGMNLDVLERAIQNHQPALIYTMPNFHNPTGITTSHMHRERLLEMVEKYNIPLVEDGFEEEMKYYGKTALPIKSMDRKKQIIYLGTFSKVLFPGLRIGWITCDKKLIKSLTAVKRVTDISSNYLAQVALEHYFKQGKYEIHLRKLHQEYRKRMQVALQYIADHFTKETIEFTKPIGGYLIWGKIKDKTITEEQLLNETNKEKVAITAGSKFYLDKPAACSFRLSIAHLNETQIVTGLTRLALALNNLVKSNK